MPGNADSSGIRPTIAEVLAGRTGELMKIPGVSGTGEGRHGTEPVVVIYVARLTPDLEKRLPKSLGGYPVEVREIGEVTAPPH